MKTIIIDDEPNSVDVLKILIYNYCPELQIIATTTESSSAIQYIDEYKPDVVFLDIKFKNTTGFEILDSVKHKSQVIFTTAYEEFALTALKKGAIDYLLKPVDKDELLIAVGKLNKLLIGSESKQNEYNRNVNLESITFNIGDKIEFIKVETIIRIEASGNYSTLFFVDNMRKLTIRKLGEIEDMLKFTSCVRVHKSHIVNLVHIKTYDKKRRSLILINNDTIPIPREKVKEVLELIEKFHYNINV